VTPPRQACPEWPRLLCPDAGCYPPAVPMRRDERILHVAFYPQIEAQVSLGKALQSIACEYAVVDWYPLQRRESAAPGTLANAVCAAAHKLKPTLVFMQLQSRTALTGAVVRRMRTLCDPRCVIIHWSGDMHYPPDDPRQQWAVELGRECDVSLTVETQFQARYAELGVRRPGFLQVAVDGTLYRPQSPTDGTPAVVFLGSCIRDAFGLWDGIAYQTRVKAVAALHSAFPGQLGTYGFGWDGTAHARPWLAPSAEAGVYSAAAASLSVSITNTIRRYTSGRLFRALNSGAVLLVERFPDLEGIGLEHGVNCLVWDSVEELIAQATEAVTSRDDLRWADMRLAAAKLGKDHTWTARMPELLALVDAVRSTRDKA